MIGFHLIIEPATPFVIPRSAIHLDALLAYCIGSRWDVSEPADIQKHLSALLDFDSRYGVYKASAMTMLATLEVGITIGSVQRPDDIRNKLIRDLFETKRSSIVIVGGPTKKRLTMRDTYHAPFLHFSGVGDVDAIKKLILYHLPGIGQDARTASTGEIKSIRTIPGEFAYSSNGKPTRNLPLAAAAEFGFSDPVPVALTPPYYNQPEQMGYAPDRVMIKPFNNFQHNG